MLIDFHAHTSGISKCCRIPAPDVLKAAKEVGLDGIILTNHYHKPYLKGEMTPSDFARKYVDEYLYTKKLGDEMGMKVFLGIEVTMEKCGAAHLLVYGADTEFILEHPDMFDYTQKELYDLVKENGYALVQAHPFRGGKTLLDLSLLDGVEANCHPLYDATHTDRLYEVAKESGLMLTCGGDFHADTYRPHCGVFIPDDTKNEMDIAEFIHTAESVKLRIHELREESWSDREFVLNRR